MWEQMEGLKDKANPPAAQPSTLAITQRGSVDPLKIIAAAGQAIQTTQDVEQGRFARARRPSDRQPIAMGDLQDQYRSAPGSRLRSQTLV